MIKPVTVAGGTRNQKPWIDRWLDLETLSHSQRYRNTYNTGDFHLFENGQQRTLAEGRLKLDAQGRYTINFRASSGRYFNWAYADYAGKGLGQREQDPAIVNSFTLPELYEIYNAGFTDPKNAAILNHIISNGWQFYIRELYFSATPLKAVTVEFGSFGIERGYASEITTFDEDGYIAGERIRIHAPEHLYFDEVGFTTAFFGDYATPNLFDRGAGFKSSNYRQVFAKKQINERIKVSADYTWQMGTDTLRQAAVIGTKESKFVDSVRFEAYERLNTLTFPGLAVSPIGPIAPLPISGASGFAITAQKTITPRLSGDLGFASIDKDYAVYDGSRFFHAGGFGLNGDNYSQGKRPFIHAAYKVNPVITAFGFYTHAVGEKVYNLNQEGMNAGLTFDLKALVNTGSRVF